MATKAQHARRYQGVPRVLKAIREEAGLTQRALGESLGKPQSWNYNSEVGNRRVDLAEFCEWCRACGQDPIAGVKKYLASIR